MAEIKTKPSFGCVAIEHISPPVGPEAPKAMNVHLTFDEALKLHFGLGQLLAKISSYNRSTKAGRRAAANLCVYPHKGRITLNERKRKKQAKASAGDPIAPSDPGPATE